MARVELKGIHRVRRKLADGTFREHHYAWRGGPPFWDSDSEVKRDSAEYVAALAATATQPKSGSISAPAMVDRYLDSADFASRAKRTQTDYRKWALRLAAEFRDDPAVLFEDPESRVEVTRWREKWSHSPKQYDYAATVACLILNWARDEGKIIKQHHCSGMRRLYKSDRSEIVWAPTDIDRFNNVAPEWARRILTVATETGLSPGDLIRLTWSHIENTPNGRRIKMRRAKTKRIASIPVTPLIDELLHNTPKGRVLILVSQRGRPLTEHRASEGVRQWRDKAGLSDTLRLEDARGTAATNLLRIGCSLGEIAAHMGWSLRYAANVIENYVAVAPELADEILVKLERARRA